MERITHGVAENVQRMFNSVSGRNFRLLMIVVAYIVTVVAVIFVSHTTRVEESNASLIHSSRSEQPTTSSKSTATDITIVQKSSTDSTKQSAGDRSIAAPTPQNSTNVEINGKSVQLNDNQTIHKVTHGANGSTSMKISSKSTSRGNNESSLNLEVDYSSETEVSRDSSSSE